MTTLYDLIKDSPRRSPPPDRESGWLQTATGKKVYPLDLRPEDIDIRDIAVALGNQCRFGGHVKHHYSVAQHSVIVADHLTPHLRFVGLLHDAPEAYILDLPRPIKHLPAFEAYRDIEARIWKVIARKYDLPMEIPEEVHKADNQALVTEADQLKAPLHPDWKYQRDRGYEALPVTIIEMDPEAATIMFLDRFHRYRAKVS